MKKLGNYFLDTDAPYTDDLGTVLVPRGMYDIIEIEDAPCPYVQFYGLDESQEWRLVLFPLVKVKPLPPEPVEN